ARRGYLFDTTEPLFPFGYGSSYTTFAYANLRLTPARIGLRDRASVSVEVTNTGKRTGDEVVQLYIRDAVSWATRPTLELRRFRRADATHAARSLRRRLSGRGSCQRGAVLRA